MDAPAVAVSADGKRVALAWMDMRRAKGERDLFWKVIEDGRGPKEVALGSDFTGEQSHASLAYLPSGEFVAAWRSRDAIVAATGKVDERRVSLPGDAGAGFPCVVHGPFGTRVIYECTRDGQASIVCRSLAEE